MKVRCHNIFFQKTINANTYYILKSFFSTFYFQSLYLRTGFKLFLILSKITDEKFKIKYIHFQKINTFTFKIIVKTQIYCWSNYQVKGGGIDISKLNIYIFIFIQFVQ